ncbi:hypothetical protein V8G54_000154 (mitochondrion) [Vigna mungo]|uniref:CCHC-type domain-containing protein n=1 Tax=Vigna mungo TaxID=3915 RepID=A0AAQ3PH83_VIGMU
MVENNIRFNYSEGNSVTRFVSEDGDLGVKEPSEVGQVREGVFEFGKKGIEEEKIISLTIRRYLIDHDNKESIIIACVIMPLLHVLDSPKVLRTLFVRLEIPCSSSNRWSVLRNLAVGLECDVEYKWYNVIVMIHTVIIEYDDDVEMFETEAAEICLLIYLLSQTKTGVDVSNMMEEVVSKEEFKRKDDRALLIIHQCVDDMHFEKIQNAASAREAWNILVGYHAEGEKVKKVKLQALRRQYEHLLMEDGDKRSLPPMFDHIVVAIEESRDLEKLKIEELQSSLEALKVQHVKNEEKKTTKKWKGKHGKGKWRKDRNKDDKNESSTEEEGKSEKNFHKKDKRNIVCFNCHRYGHYFSECYAETGEQKKSQENEAYAAQVESNSEPIILMKTTSTVSSHSQDKLWYLDSGFSNRMTCHRDWLVNFAETKRSMVRFFDDNTSKVEGVGDVVIRRKNGSCAILTSVLFVLAIRYNLLSIGQLIQKGLTVMMRGFNKVEVFDKSKNLILRSKISKDKTFQISLVKCVMCEETDKMNTDTRTGNEEGLVHVAILEYSSRRIDRSNPGLEEIRVEGYNERKIDISAGEKKNVEVNAAKEAWGVSGEPRHDNNRLITALNWQLHSNHLVMSLSCSFEPFGLGRTTHASWHLPSSHDWQEQLLNGLTSVNYMSSEDTVRSQRGTRDRLARIGATSKCSA